MNAGSALTEKLSRLVLYLYLVYKRHRIILQELQIFYYQSYYFQMLKNVGSVSEIWEQLVGCPLVTFPGTYDKRVEELIDSTLFGISPQQGH